MPPAAPRPGAQRGSRGAMRLSSGTGRARGATVGACEWGGGAAAGPASAPRCLARSAPPPPSSGAGGPRGAQPKPRARPPRRLLPAPPAAVRVPGPPAARQPQQRRGPDSGDRGGAPRDFSPYLPPVEKQTPGLPLVVQWSRIRAPNAWGAGSIPTRRTKIPQAAPCSQNIKKKKKQTPVIRAVQALAGRAPRRTDSSTQCEFLGTGGHEPANDDRSSRE